MGFPPYGLDDSVEFALDIWNNRLCIDAKKERAKTEVSDVSLVSLVSFVRGNFIDSICLSWLPVT